MNRKCVITDKEYPIKYLRKTENGEYVLFDIYSHCTFELRKGLLTTDEIRSVLALYEEYYESFAHLVRYIRRRAVVEKKHIHNVLNEVEKESMELSIKMFKKYSTCLELREHIIIIDVLTHEFTETPKIVTRGSTITDKVRNRLMLNKDRVIGSVSLLHNCLAKDI